jgi:hypothetical protein
MALKWKDVIKKPEYQALDPKEKVDAQAQYFDEVVAPRAGNDVEAAREQFYKQYPPGGHSELFGEESKPKGEGKHADDGSFTAFMAGTISSLNEAGNKLRGWMRRAGLDSGDSRLAKAAGLDVHDSDEHVTQQMAQAENRVENSQEAHPTAVSVGEVVGESIPSIVGWEAGAGFLPELNATTKLGKVASVVAKNTAGSVGSQIAQGDAPSLGQTAEDTVFGTATHGLLHAAGKGIRGLGKNATKAEIEAAESVAKAEDAEAERITSKLSPEALGYVLAHSGDERNELIKQLAEQTGQNFEELQAAIQSIGGDGENRLVDLTKEGLRGNFDKLAQEVQTSEERMQMARDLGLNPDVMPASFFSDNQQFIEFYQALKQMPASVLSPLEKDALDKTSEVADNLITKYGGTTDLSELDQSVRDTFSELIGSLKTQSDALYEMIFSRIADDTPMQAAHSLGVISDEIRKLGGRADQLEKEEKEILSKLSPVKQPDGSMKLPTYYAVDKVRRAIGQAIGGKKSPYADADRKMLNRLYAALTQDQEAIAESAGLGADLKTAKKLVTSRKALEEKNTDLYGKQIANSIVPKLRGAVLAATKGDASKITQLLDSVPEDMRKKVAVSALHYLFINSARNTGKSLSIPGFVWGYKALNNNRVARETLFKYLPNELKSDLAKFHTYAEGVNAAISAVPKTGLVGTISQEFKAADTMAEKILTGEVSGQTKLLDKALGHTPYVGGAYRMMKGIAKDGLQAEMGNPKDRLKAGMEMLASPEFLDAARHYANRKIASESAIKRADEALLRSQKYKKWFDRLSGAEKNLLNTLGPYRVFAFWATLRAAESSIDTDEQEE